MTVSVAVARTVRMRVTARGGGQIRPGRIGAAADENIRFFKKDMEFDCPVESVQLLEERGLAVRVAMPDPPAPVPIMPQPPAPKSREPVRPIDPEAVARLMQRCARDERTGCLVWQGSKAQGGYGQITYKKTAHRTHRLSWSAHHGEIPKGVYVCHACDNPACIAVEHLFLGTPEQNYADMRNKGRTRYNAKLTLADVATIKNRLAAGETAIAIARDFAVRYGQILNIKLGHAWRDVKAAAE
jgi:hypothetical protein